MTKKRKRKIWKIAAVIAVIAVAAIAVPLFIGKDTDIGFTEEQAIRRDITTFYTFTGNVEPENDYSVIADVSEKVLSVNVKEGDEVKTGDIIAVLDSTDIQNNITTKENSMGSSNVSENYSISSSRTTYEDYKNGIENGTNSQLNSAGSTLDNAKTNLENAKKKYDDAKAKRDSGSESSLISAETSVENALKDLNDAEQDYEDYLAKSKKEDYYSIKNLKDAVEAANDAYRDKLFGRDSEKLNEAKQKYTDAEYYYNYQKNLDPSIADKEELEKARTALESARSEYEKLSSNTKTLDDLKDEYDEAVRNYNDAKDNIDDTHDSTLSSLKRAAEKAQTSYESALRNLDDTKQTLEDNLDTYYDSYQSAQRAYDEAVKNYETISLNVQQTLDSYKSAYEKNLELSGYSSDELELQTLYDRLDSCTLKANADGVISEINLTEGGYAVSNQAAAVITDYSKLKITIKIDEYDINKVKVNDKVDIYINALDKNIEGTITDISVKAQTSGGVSYFTAEVSIDPDDEVKAGMSAEVKLVSRFAENAVSVPIDALQFEDNNTAYVLVKGSDGSHEKKPVTVGTTDGTYIEITDGLSENDIVMYVPSNNSPTIDLPITRIMGGDKK